MGAKPNILFLLSDEHSFRFRSSLDRDKGGEPVKTPTLDRLAAHGAVFEHAYCSVPLCTPSRMCLMTGQDAIGCGAIDNGSLLDPNQDTLPKALGRAGYETALIGKMHFNGSNQFHGFAHRPYGDLVGSAIHQWEDIAWPQDADAPAELVIKDKSKINDNLASRTADAGRTRIPESLLCDRMVAEETVAFLRNHAANSAAKPWFVCASFSRPHFPLTAPARHLSHYDRDSITEPFVPAHGASFEHPVSCAIRAGFETDRIDHAETMNARAAYFACVTYLDEILGDVLIRLEADGLLENTIVVYASDHGEMAGELGTWWKSGWYEACCRVPLIVSMPEHRNGQLAPSRIETAVSLGDLAPTLAAFAGARLDEPVTGIDLSGAVRGDALRDRPIFCDHLNDRWGRGSEFRAIRWRNWKYVSFRDHEDLLFDLEQDPGERTNIIADAPAALLAMLRGHAVDYGQLEPVSASQAELKRRFPLSATGATPSQFLLDEGKLVAADVTIYRPSILALDASTYFTDWPAGKVAEKATEVL